MLAGKQHNRQMQRSNKVLFQKQFKVCYRYSTLPKPAVTPTVMSHNKKFSCTDCVTIFQPKKISYTDVPMLQLVFLLCESILHMCTARIIFNTCTHIPSHAHTCMYIHLHICTHTCTDPFLLHTIDRENPPPLATVVPPLPIPRPPTKPFPCGDVYVASSGSFHSPGYYAFDYRTNQDCAWVLKGSENHRLTITFNTIRMEDS